MYILHFNCESNGGNCPAVIVMGVGYGKLPRHELHNKASYRWVWELYMGDIYILWLTCTRPYSRSHHVAASFLYLH